MKTLIKGVKVIYPGHSANGKRLDVLTDGTKILEIGSIKGTKNEIDGKRLVLFPGLVDAQCFTGEPGNEDKEDLQSLTASANVGGFRHLMLLPSTDPVVDSKSSVEYLKRKSGLNNVQLHPLGAVTKGLNGSELSEMYDMHRSGAVAFTDGKQAIADVNMMKRALLYSKNFGGLVYSFPNDERVSPGGMVNESPSSTSLGLKSAPPLAEEIMLNRDIYLLGYTDSKMHVASISSRNSVKLIGDAKKRGLDLTAAVPAANLLYNEEELHSFDTNFKTSPPLREAKDQKELIKAVEKGTIDMIISDHTPELIENKDVEFDQAAYGMTMLETVLPAMLDKSLAGLDLESIIQAMSINPRKRFDLPMPSLEKNADFDFTLFDPKEKWTYTASGRKSKALNSPLLGKELTGKVVSL